MKKEMQSLVEQAKAGEQDAFAAIYDATSEEIYRTIRSMVRDEALALDIQQETYVHAFTHLDQLGDPEKLLPWLRAISVNRTRSVLRKQSAVLFTDLPSDEEGWIPELPDLRPENLPEEALEQKETSRLIREILDDLTDSQRMLVGMYYYEQIPVTKIAQDLNLSPGTVKTQLARSRKKVESRIRWLEARGVKLYGLSPMPFLLALLKRLRPEEKVEKKVLAGALTESGVAQTALIHVGTGFFHSVAAKVLAGLTAAAIIGGGIAGFSWYRNRSTEPVIGDAQLSNTVYMTDDRKMPEDSSLQTEDGTSEETADVIVTWEDSPEDMTETPTEATTETPTEPPTNPPTEPPTEAPTEPPTEPPTNPVGADDHIGPAPEPTSPQPANPTPTDPSTEPPTEAPTEAPTDSPTEPPTEPPTNPVGADDHIGPAPEPTNPQPANPTPVGSEPATEAPTDLPEQPIPSEPTQQDSIFCGWRWVAAGDSMSRNDVGIGSIDILRITVRGNQAPEVYTDNPDMIQLNYRGRSGVPDDFPEDGFLYDCDVKVVANGTAHIYCALDGDVVDQLTIDCEALGFRDAYWTTDSGEVRDGLTLESGETAHLFVVMHHSKTPGEDGFDPTAWAQPRIYTDAPERLSFTLSDSPPTRVASFDFGFLWYGTVNGSGPIRVYIELNGQIVKTLTVQVP